jgi:hypothetical protein
MKTVYAIVTLQEQSIYCQNYNEYRENYREDVHTYREDRITIGTIEELQGRWGEL